VGAEKQQQESAMKIGTQVRVVIISDLGCGVVVDIDDDVEPDESVVVRFPAHECDDPLCTVKGVVEEMGFHPSEVHLLSAEEAREVTTHLVN
jgi:hypothetical protein